MKKQLHLDMLISSHEELKERNCLSPTGIGFLDGLKRAREIIFPKPKSKNKN